MKRSAKPFMGTYILLICSGLLIQGCLSTIFYKPGKAYVEPQADNQDTALIILRSAEKFCKFNYHITVDGMTAILQGGSPSHQVPIRLGDYACAYSWRFPVTDGSLDTRTCDFPQSKVKSPLVKFDGIKAGDIVLISRYENNQAKVEAVTIEALAPAPPQNIGSYSVEKHLQALGLFRQWIGAPAQKLVADRIAAMDDQLWAASSQGFEGLGGYYRIFEKGRHASEVLPRLRQLIADAKSNGQSVCEIASRIPSGLGKAVLEEIRGLDAGRIRTSGDHHRNSQCEDGRGWGTVCRMRPLLFR